jgi:S-adenosylmethionine:tRNA-ribosyltransferase-isomerase (queuine synthetase)
MSFKDIEKPVRGLRKTIDDMQKHVEARNTHAEQFEELRAIAAGANVFCVGSQVIIHCESNRDKTKLLKLLKG